MEKRCGAWSVFRFGNLFKFAEGLPTTWFSPRSGIPAAPHPTPGGGFQKSIPCPPSSSAKRLDPSGPVSSPGS